MELFKLRDYLDSVSSVLLSDHAGNMEAEGYSRKNIKNHFRFSRTCDVCKCAKTAADAADILKKYDTSRWRFRQVDGTLLSGNF